MAAASVAEPRKRGLSLATFSAFQSRPFALLWTNTFTFALSQAIRQFTFVWLALELSGRGQVLGAISFALGIPVLLLGLPFGAIADRMDRRLLLVLTQIAAFAITLVAAALTWAGGMSIPVLFALALALGATMAAGAPVRSAIVPTLVTPDRLMNAITLNSLGQNLSQVVGPALAGAVIAVAGVGNAFLLQAVLLAVGAVTLLPLRVPRPGGAKRGMAGEVREGLSYVAHHPGIRTLMLVLVATALVMAGTFMTLIPKIAKDELETGAFGASALFGAMGVGSLMASLLLASLTRLERAGRAFIFTLICGGLLNAAFGLSPWYPVSLGIMFVTGWNAGFFTNLNMTLVQSHTPQAIMGRVMSIYTLCMMGAQPLGSLLAGGMADVFGTREWFTASGVMLAIVGVLVLTTQPALTRMTSRPSAQE